MKPIGMLMWEHRLIEQVIGLFPREIAKIGKSKRVDTVFIQVAVDFIRTYADLTHHGKEEDILFRILESHGLSPELHKIMEGLINDHVYARNLVKGLVEANEKYISGENTLSVIVNRLQYLADFYPAHIEKEDKHFFHQSMRYLDASEQEEMLGEFKDFDRRMIHEKYKEVVERLAGGKVSWTPPGMVR